MRALRTTGVIVSFLLLAAHFLRGGHALIALVLLAAPFLLLARESWAVRVLQVALLLGTLEWIRTLVALTSARLEAGEPYLRMTLILAAVAAVAALSAIGLSARRG
ncbi:MAG: hypothetical protein OES32_04355 [Acidobacteriota bacterium]|nr:hypothetical protein [Acidobacteriota bacterium]MDH3522796.1 hypothetical protein [Acidobacteriota bacterium]